MIDTGLVIQFQVFLLVFARIFGMMTLAPFFSSRRYPRFRPFGSPQTMIKILPALSSRSDQISLHYILQLGRGPLVRIAIGFLVGVFRSTRLPNLSMQMGLSITNVFDPQAQSKSCSRPARSLRDTCLHRRRCASPSLNGI